MLLLVCLFAVFEILLILMVFPVKRSWRLALLYADLIIMIVGYTIYIIKTGGYRESFVGLFIFSDRLLNYINHVSISYSKLYLIIQYTRLLFPSLVLLVSFDAKFSKHKSYTRVKKYIYALPCLIFMILLNDEVYVELFSGMFQLQSALQILTLLYVFIFIGASCYIFAMEIKNTYLSWYRKQTIYLAVSILAVICIYSVFFIMDPLLLIQDYKNVRVGTASYFINSKINSIYLLVISFLMAISLVINNYAMYKSAKIEYDETRLELKIRKTMKDTGMISGGLLHGLKNQLLTEKVLTLNIIEMIEAGGSKDELVGCLQELLEEHNLTFSHLEIVRKSLSDFETHLVLDKTVDIFSELENQVHRKYPCYNISFKVEDGGILADRVLLMEAVSNLIDNAVDAVDGDLNKKITVEVSFTRAYCVIEVSDNGRGIREGIRKNIFLPFVTDKNTQKNWGFGLCFTRQVVKKHLGDIRFETKEGVGSKFFITLPRLY